MNEEMPVTSETSETPDAPGTPEVPPKKRRTVGAVLFDYVEMFAWSVFAVLLIFTFGFRLCQVDGQSMENSLHNGERLLLFSAGYTPRQDDIVVFHLTEPEKNLEKTLVKRVIAKGGDTISIDYATGTVEVNGKVLEEDYIAEPTYLGYDVEFPYTVPEGTVFVMGDNRNASLDSRSSYVGCIDEQDILGKVLLCFLPFSDFGVVK